MANKRADSSASEKSSNPCILEIWLREGNSDVKDIVTMSADMILAGIDTVRLKR